MARATFQVLPQVALWSYKERKTWMSTVKVIAETKIAAFIQLDTEAYLALPSSVRILKAQKSCTNFGSEKAVYTPSLLMFS